MQSTHFLFFRYLFRKIDSALKMGTCTKSGRNFSGKICVHHRGGALKSNYCIIDFKRRVNQKGLVYGTIYDPYRTAVVGAILYDNGYFSTIILSGELPRNYKLFSGIKKPIVPQPGDAYGIGHIPLFSIVNNIESRPYKGSTIARAAGLSAIVVARNDTSTFLKLRSNWTISISNNCIATLGQVSNRQHRSVRLEKAGRSRRMGRRPVVRGVAMNPCDHPHGGGEGKKSPPVAHKSPWGWLTKGTPSLKSKERMILKRLYKVKKRS